MVVLEILRGVLLYRNGHLMFSFISISHTYLLYIMQQAKDTMQSANEPTKP